MCPSVHTYPLASHCANSTINYINEISCHYRLPPLGLFRAKQLATLSNNTTGNKTLKLTRWYAVIVGHNNIRSHFENQNERN